MASIQIGRYNILFILVQYFISGKCEKDTHIIGGGFANISDFPYVAYLAIFPDKETDYPVACCSSILNRYLILTAAHCLEGCTQHSQVIVSAGDVTRYIGTVSSASAFVILKHFDQSNFNNDIALIKLTIPFEFGANIGYVSLMKNPPSHEKEAKVAGWGVTEVGIISQHLKYLNQNVINRKKCIGVLGVSLNRNAICGVSKRGYPARGDSGAALVIRGNIQIGIVSFGFPEISNETTVYTEVTKYITWIQEIWDRLK